MIPTLAEVFGANATQTATAITIQKSDLPTLTPSATNTAQQLLVALILKAKERLNVTARDSDSDVKVTVEYSGQSVFTLASSTNLDRQDSFTVTLHQEQPSVQIDADDY